MLVDEQVTRGVNARDVALPDRPLELHASGRACRCDLRGEYGAVPPLLVRQRGPAKLERNRNVR